MATYSIVFWGFWLLYFGITVAATISYIQERQVFKALFVFMVALILGMFMSGIFSGGV